MAASAGSVEAAGVSAVSVIPAVSAGGVSSGNCGFSGVGSGNVCGSIMAAASDAGSMEAVDSAGNRRSDAAPLASGFAPSAGENSCRMILPMSRTAKNAASSANIKKAAVAAGDGTRTFFAFR